MLSETRFYLCKECGAVELKLGSDADLTCCGKDMTPLKANTTDAALEKHVPAVSREGNTLRVQVGSTLHPMLPEHYITLVVAEQGDRVQRTDLQPGQQPVAEFQIEEGPVTVYEYCNLHSLWKAEA